MGKTKNGPNGSVKGKVGNLIYSSWRGIEYVKTRPARRRSPNKTEKANHWVFGTFTEDWMRPIKEYLRIGFKGYTQTNQGITAAKSYLYKNALTQDGYNSSIDPEKMLVSYGSLGLAGDIQVQLEGGSELVFSWDTSLDRDKAPNDQVMLLAYHIDQGKAAYSLGGDFRKAGSARLDVNHLPQGSLHVYLSFVAYDHSRQSDSCYLGKVEL